MSASKKKNSAKIEKAKGLLGNWAVKNLLLGVAFVLGFVLLVSICLSLFTQHNREIEVPDFANLTFQESRKLASHSGVKVVVDDSLYVRRLKPGVVCSQNPKAGEKVKHGRRIFLTTNTVVPKQVSMPSLVGFSMRQARAELVRNGLVLGKLIYVSDIATNNVMNQQFGGRTILAGEMITSGSKIDLVVGLSSYENMTHVPNVVGRQYLRATDLIQDNSLNLGSVSFDESVTNYADSVNAVVYSQKPSAGSDAIKMGSEVSVSLTVNPDKMAK